MLRDMFKATFGGAAAGAAGTAALDATTYLDMAWRGRPASRTPQQAAEKLAQLAGHRVPGAGDVRENRLTGLGALEGIATGVGVGAVAGVVYPILKRLGPVISAIVIGATAMGISDGALTRLGVTDPSDWNPADWAADAVPHLVFGAVTYATLSAMRR